MNTSEHIYPENLLEPIVNNSTHESRCERPATFFTFFAHTMEKTHFANYVVPSRVFAN